MRAALAIGVVALALGLSGCSAVKKADKAFAKWEYEEAIERYESLTDNPKYATHANLQIGHAYRRTNRLEEALPYYQAAVDSRSTHEEANYYLALALKANGEYDRAKEQLERYMEIGRDDSLMSLAELEMRNLAAVEALRQLEDYYTIEPVKELNTSAPEYAPTFFKGILYFTSARDDDKEYKATGTAFTDIYKVRMDEAGLDPASVSPLPEFINQQGVNEGTVAFSPDGRICIFARGNTGKKRDGKHVNFYISYRNRQGGWTEPKMMLISDPGAFDTSPSFSADGRTLYFASNRAGGFGGIDLWSATINRRGRFSRVRNMGSVINTPGHELFPYASDDGKLYFSSTGHPGFGRLDLFVAQRKDGETTVTNLGPTVNSPADDFGLTLIDPMNGFLSSDRKGGAGGDDIYQFVNGDPNVKLVNYFLAGVSYTHNEDEQKVILPSVHVRLFGKDNELLQETITDEQGRFQFRVYENEDYLLMGERDQYFTSRQSFTTVGRSLDRSKLTELVTDTTFRTEIVLDRIVVEKAIVLQNIYYDLDKADIRPDAAAELDKLVALLQDNPSITIELSSHTDARATVLYNQELSSRRAKNAVEYIVNQGVDQDRIRAKGYGESQLIIEDAQTEEEHQINRRTEFKVLTYEPVPEEDEIEQAVMVTEEDQDAEGFVPLEQEEAPSQPDPVYYDDLGGWESN